MRSTLTELNCVLDELDSFVKSIDPVNTTLATHQDGVVRQYLSIRKRLDNAAFIVALYAALERFIEDLVWSFAEIESAATKYAEMPERLRGKHLRISGDLLSRGRLGEGKYVGTSNEEIINNLHHCLTGKYPYKLNRHAIIFHEHNCRAEIINNIFTDIGIDNINDIVRKNKNLLAWYCEIQGIGDSSSETVVPATAIEARLQDLVERRNQITHRGCDPDDSLGSSELPERLGFVRAYCSSLFQVLVGKYLERAYVDSCGASTKLDPVVLGPIRDHIVVVPKPSCLVYTGQPIIGTCDGRIDRWGLILEIQVDEDPVERVELNDPVSEIGLKVDFKLSKRTQLYLLPRKDNIVWV